MKSKIIEILSAVRWIGVSRDEEAERCSQEGFRHHDVGCFALGWTSADEDFNFRRVHHDAHVLRASRSRASIIAQSTSYPKSDHPLANFILFQYNIFIIMDIIYTINIF